VPDICHLPFHEGTDHNDHQKGHAVDSDDQWTPEAASEIDEDSEDDYYD
jgi:hypothetical protein